MKRLALLLVTLGACAHSNAPVATDADITRARSQFPNVTLEELNQGRSLYVGHCGGCHLPQKPTDFTAEEWPEHVSEMRERAGLTFEEQSLVIRYVQVMSTAR